MKYDFEQCYGSRIRSLSRKVDNIYRKHLGNSGITENQLSIMMALSKTGRVEQHVIGKYLSLEKSSLSRNLIRIMAAGYVRKEGISNKPSIELTPKGKRKVDQLVPRWEKAMDEINQYLSASDANSFDPFEMKLSRL